ncbi:MAG: beta-lactamase family protein, partial [Anaerolineae bacterium]|nr:beta-lactamase family protein [Anaerolineae bacterium]
LFAPDAWIAFGLLFLVILLALAGVQARRSLLLVMVMALCLAVPATSYADGPVAFADRLDQHMPALLDRYGVPGTVVASIQNGAVVWTKAYGVANRATGEPMRPDMVFEHGSNGKALTAWAILRLVEQGKVGLDAPANQYLKRWQIPSNEFDANQIKVRHLLAHTSGLTIHGFLDYSPRRASLPSVVEVLQGKHLLEGIVEQMETGRPSWGEVEIVQAPGTAYKYSGGGYSVLQLLIEDVTGEPFAQFMQREVTDPLGATGVRWTWTPELQARAATPYSVEQQPLEYRQLAVQAIGSEIATVTDYARFLAAAVEGPTGEPRGRGVLQPESVDMMLTPQVGANGYGLGYGLGRINYHAVISHGGANSGWMAYFSLDTVTREGFVIASNSSRSSPFHMAVRNEWLDAAYGPGSRADFPPDPTTEPVSAFFQLPATLLGAAWPLALAWFLVQVRSGRRAWGGRPTPRVLGPALGWLLPLLFLWYWVYSPLPLVLPAAWPDLWPMRAVGYLLGVLLAWAALSVVIALYPQQRVVRRPVLRPIGRAVGFGGRPP